MEGRITLQRHLEGVDGLAVADAFELAVELGCRIVGVAVFFFVVGFGLTLFQRVVKVGLGKALEGEQRDTECGCGWVEGAALFVRVIFSAPVQALEEKYDGEEQEKGEKGPEEDAIDVHGRPFGLRSRGVDRRDSLADQTMAAAIFFVCGGIRLVKEEDAERGWTERDG
jgi:hypothetical protein